MRPRDRQSASAAPRGCGVPSDAPARVITTRALDSAYPTSAQVRSVARVVMRDLLRRTDQPADRVLERRDVEWLGQVSLARPPLRRLLIEDVAVAGDDERLDARMPLAEPADQLLAGHRRHQVVGDDQIELL